MIELVSWRESLEEARIEARETNKGLLIDLHDPESDGCQFMRDHTYTDLRVSRLINSISVPSQFNVINDPGAKLRYHSFWTPTIVFNDAEDNEHRRSYGVLTPEQFLAEFSLGHGLMFLHTGRFQEAIDALEHSRNYTAVDPDRNAENHYWLGVARYRATGDPAEQEYAWQKMRANHPHSDWARKTDFYFQD